MHKKLIYGSASLAFLLSTLAVAHAATLTVGPGKQYQTVSAAIAAANNGDTIEVDAGMYTDDFSTINKSLTIRGVGGMAHLHGTVNIPNQKGIFAISGNNTEVIVENIEFSGAKVSAGSGNNGAGIRMQGLKLEVRNCYFHDNQNGILSGGVANHEILIEYSEFDSNGNQGSGFEHNIYASGDMKKLTVRHSYLHRAKSGHNLKSRAKENHVLYNRIMDEQTGTASYSIDLTQGGLSYVIGNLIQQGPNAENKGTIVNYGDSTANPIMELYVINNTIVNDSSNTSTRFVRIHKPTSGKMANNLLVGQGNILEAAGGSTISETDNLLTQSPMLVDRSGYDYTLQSGSPAINQGSPPGMGAGMSLDPVWMYVHPLNRVARTSNGAIDIGAYEFGSTVFPDAGVPDATVDSGSPGQDAGPPGDSGTPSDSTIPGSDSGAPVDGAPSTDSATSDGSAAGDGGSGGLGGGCAIQSSHPTWLMLLVLCALLRRRNH